GDEHDDPAPVRASPQRLVHIPSPSTTERPQRKYHFEKVAQRTKCSRRIPRKGTARRPKGQAAALHFSPDLRTALTEPVSRCRSGRRPRWPGSATRSATDRTYAEHPT